MHTPSIGAALLCLVLPLAPLTAQDHRPPHARLGILLDGGDSLGVRVRGVVPEGPAQQAGLRRGDVITRFNGTPLSGSDNLVELARGLAPGDTVRVEYRRDGQPGTATVVARSLGPEVAMRIRRMPGMGGDFGNRAPGVLFFRHRSTAGGLQLVPMSRDLGEYFGTSEGMLVVTTPADSASPLKAGDVLLAIDGRKPQSVRHAFGILRSYAPGEKAKLEVMRRKQRTTLTWTAPARRGAPDWPGGLERSEGPEPADLFEFDLPALPGPDLGET